MTSHRDRRLHYLLLAILAGVMIWSWIAPADRTTWWLESFPIFLALPVVFATARSFPLTRLAYVLITYHAIILLVGAHYTYEHVPLFNWVRDHFHLARNDYDRLGHLTQGFVPAIIAREILIRRRIVSSAGWVTFLVLCVCMAISACYELLEWATAEILKSGADQFLGTQGDPWDTQWDMFSCLIGATLALLLLSKLHNREIARIESPV